MLNEQSSVPGHKLVGDREQGSKHLLCTNKVVGVEVTDSGRLNSMVILKGALEEAK